jgi:hypothetical protein
MLEKQIFLQLQLVSRREQSPNSKYQSRRDSVKLARSLHKVTAILPDFNQNQKFFGTC